jgi:hypothetical protein
MTETNTTNISAAGEGTPPSQVVEESLLSETKGEKPGFLGRIRKAVGNLALRLIARGEDGQANRDNSGADSENSDGAEETAETLDDETLQRIEEIEERCDFYVDILLEDSDIADMLMSGKYEEIEKFIPNIRELVASDGRLNPESEDYDFDYAGDTLLRLARNSVKELFRRQYEHMPKLTDKLRHVMWELINSVRSLADSYDPSYIFDNEYQHSMFELIGVERMLPEGVAEEFRDMVLSEVARYVTMLNHNCDYGYKTTMKWLEDRGFPPCYWPRDAREREDFPEPLRQVLVEDAVSHIDHLVIEYYGRGDRGEWVDAEVMHKYFEARWLGMIPSEICGSYDGYLIYYWHQWVNDMDKVIDGVGLDNAKKLQKELGITHFGDWSPETLRGTLKLLETGRTESGNPATIIVRGATGDHNGSAGTYGDIESPNTFAVEINHTSDLSRVVKKLEGAGVDSNTFDTLVLFGHGSESRFFMSSDEKIPPNYRKWRNKKGMRSLIETLGIGTIILDSCHPLVREKRFNALMVGDEPQQRRGTAVALSKAFPGVQVISGLDGATSSYIIKGTGNMQITTEDKGTINASSMTAVTKNGLTRVHREEVKIQ